MLWGGPAGTRIPTNVVSLTLKNNVTRDILLNRTMTLKILKCFYGREKG